MDKFFSYAQFGPLVLIKMCLLLKSHGLIVSADDDFCGQYRMISDTRLLSGWIKVSPQERDFPLQKNYPVLWAICSIMNNLLRAPCQLFHTLVFHFQGV